MTAAPAIDRALPPVIDGDHLDRVTFRDRAFRDEVLTLFIREARALGGQLAGATSPADWRIAAHTLKGMSHGVGAVRLAAAAEQAERLPPETPAAGRRAALEPLSEDIARAIAEAQSLVAAG